MTGRVVVVGAVEIALVVDVTRLPGPGEEAIGTGFRRYVGGQGTTLAMAALSAGAEVAVVGRVGADDAGQACRRMLADQGADLSGLTEDPWLPTGHRLTWVDPEGRRAGVAVAGAVEGLTPDAIEAVNRSLRGPLGPGDVVLVGGGVPVPVVPATVRRARERSARIVLALSTYRRVPDDVLGYADPVVVGESGALFLADSAAVPGSLAVTFGNAGAAWRGIPAIDPDAGRSVAGVEALEPSRDDPPEVVDAFAGALAAGFVTVPDPPGQPRRLGVGGSRTGASESGASEVTGLGGVDVVPHPLILGLRAATKARRGGPEGVGVPLL